MKTEPTKAGRPKMPSGMARSTMVALRFTPGQYEGIKNLSRKLNVIPSRYMASQVLTDPRLKLFAEKSEP